jgi:hypothetical protein
VCIGIHQAQQLSCTDPSAHGWLMWPGGQQLSPGTLTTPARTWRSPPTSWQWCPSFRTASTVPITCTPGFVEPLLSMKQIRPHLPQISLHSQMPLLAIRKCGNIFNLYGSDCGIWTLLLVSTDWLAGIIDEGLDFGVYRRGMWYVNRVHDELTEGPRAEQPDAKFVSQGWEDVLTHLRSHDDEPVVLSYSVCDQFPNANEALDYLPPWPEGVPHSYDALTYEQQAEHDRLWKEWYDLPSERQWELGMAGLRQNKPWARLSPKTLGSIFFHVPVSVYDLFAPDRDDRIAAAFKAGEA